ILKNREYVLNLIAKKYGFESLWNDSSGFVYLFKKNVTGAYDSKTKKRQYTDEKEVIKRIGEFIEGLTEWAINDPSC
ncbi:hypothetical protein HYW99_03770, partial [Candidatus Woesearchaeota archaeon]|nr:hypothetical protein [Candidatus Woesearchaeota archaeon]